MNDKKLEDGPLCKDQFCQKTRLSLRSRGFLMKHLQFLFFAFVLGCNQSVSDGRPDIDEATGLKLAYELSFIVENEVGHPVGCATLLSVEDDSFCIAASVDLVTQPGCRLVEWRGEPDGQKFQRVLFPKFEVVTIEPSLKLAVLKVLGATFKQPVKFARAENREFFTNRVAYSARASQPRPIESMSVKVIALHSARAAPDQPSANFYHIESTLDFKMLGSPLVTQQGELAGVAVGNFWHSTLYCPASTINDLLSSGREVSRN